MTIGEYRDQLLIYDDTHAPAPAPAATPLPPYWLTPFMYWCMTLLLVSYPYRVWLSWRCPVATMHVIKELRNVSVQDQQAPPVVPLVIAAAAAHTASGVAAAIASPLPSPGVS